MIKASESLVQLWVEDIHRWLFEPLPAIMSNLSTYIVTFNCGRIPIHASTLSTHLFSALPPRSPAPDIVVLCLQELAPIAYSFLGRAFLVPYLTPFRNAVRLAAAAHDHAEYVNIIVRNRGMTAIMVFVLRDQTSQVKWLETASVGVGVHEMGNKGAVAVRLGWAVEDSTLEMTFVSAHLAPMEDNLTRRNEDYKNIVRGLVFTPVSITATRKLTTQRLPQEPSSSETEPLLSHDPPEEDSIPPMSGIYTPTSHLIFAGDLNYRTSSTAPPETAYLTWPQPTNDTSAPEHFSHLLHSDQLLPERQAGHTLHGLREAPINFPPTYKYSAKARSNAQNLATLETKGEGYWDWSKHRYPSWCDRVLYLDIPSWMKRNNPKSEVKVQGYKALPLMETSDHRPVACSLLIPAQAIPEPEDEGDEEVKRDARVVPPFGIDPQWKEKREWARRKEVVVGVVAYATLTWEGRGIVLFLLFGAVGGITIAKSLLEM